MTVIVPIEQTEATATLARADYEALIGRLEDAHDLTAISRDEAWRAAAGEEEARRLSYTATEMRRMMLDGVSPIVIWRERTGPTQGALARAAADVSQSYLAEIEGGRKPGSAVALRAIAGVLRVPMEHLLP